MDEVNQKRTHLSLLLFFFGLLLTILLMQIPSSRHFIIEFSQSGIWGTLVAGILYAFAFTSSMATAIFWEVPRAVNPFLIAIVGGLGAALYDITVFMVIKREAQIGFLGKINSLLTRRKMPRWLSFLIGIIILGSPLPDELAAGFFGFFKISTKQFIVLSLAANTVGILVILLLR